LVAHPSPNNILDWHYVLKGGQGTDYEGGYYHGKIVFPEQYPFKPPAISVVTPSGRFHTNMRLCLSMSDFHPETWNPMWSVSTILTGLMSFMYDDVATTGSMHVSSSERRRLAKESVHFNLKSPVFCKVGLCKHTSRIRVRALWYRCRRISKVLRLRGPRGTQHKKPVHISLLVVLFFVAHRIYRYIGKLHRKIACLSLFLNFSPLR
jgi:ubiquitin-conjugating enzyme E2 J2